MSILDSCGFLAVSRVLRATETSMPASLRMSRVGRVTKPAPSIRTFFAPAMIAIFDVEREDVRRV